MFLTCTLSQNLLILVPVHREIPEYHKYKLKENRSEISCIKLKIFLDAPYLL